MCVCVGGDLAELAFILWEESDASQGLTTTVSYNLFINKQLYPSCSGSGWGVFISVRSAMFYLWDTGRSMSSDETEGTILGFALSSYVFVWVLRP